MEFAHHRARDRKPARDIFHLREGGLLRRADVNEQRDEDQKWIPNQSDKSKDERKTLADAGSDLCGPRIAQPRRKQSAQDAAAIHWECGQQIKKEQQDVDRQQLRDEAAPFER